MNDNSRGYGCFTMFVSAVSFIFAAVALLKWDHFGHGVWAYEISASEFVVSALSAIITFVVAWQIWQVIDTRNIIKETQERYDKEKTIREEQFKNYSERLSLFTFASYCANDAIFMLQELHIIKNYNLTSSRRVIGYNVAYRNLFRSLRDALMADVPETERLVDICLDNMQSCLSNAEDLKKEYERYARFDKRMDSECDNLYNLIKQSHNDKLNRRQHSLLDDLQERQKKLTK